MSFNVILPITITDAILTGSNVPEADLQEWEAGTAYAVGDTVMVATSTADVHKTYECFVAQSAGLTADILDENFSDISDWTDADTGTAESEISPAGQLRLDTNGSHVSHSKIYKTLASPPNTHTIEVKIYSDLLGEFNNSDALELKYAEVLLRVLT